MREKLKPKVIKVVLTGGHAATSALSLIEEFFKASSKENPPAQAGWQIYWIGPASSYEGKKHATLEQRVLPRLGVVSFKIVMGRIQRKWTRYTIPAMAKIPFGFFHALILLLKIKPDVVLSFGGFAAFPVVFVSFLLRIPVVIHEQTVTIGLANKLSAVFAKKIAVSRKQSFKHFAKEKTSLTGLPLMSNVLEVLPKSNISEPPTIYITGGSRGAQRINAVVDQILESLLEKYYVIHQTGELDYDYFSERKKKMNVKFSPKYEVYSFIDPQEVGSIYKRCDIIIARAGAHTVAEIMATGRPAVLIPIPWARFDEQKQNAEMAVRVGIAKVIEEKDLNPESLVNKISEVKSNWQKMVKMAKKTYTSLDRRAAHNLLNLVRGCINT